MEDLQPISTAEQSAFCVEMLKRLNIQRNLDYLCDIILVSKDSSEFKAHRNVLSAVSPFFCKLLQSDMKENREGVIRFDEISGSVMGDVLEFIYSGTVEVTQENAKELMAAGNYLIIPSLKTVSGRYLEGKMSNSNCISTFYLAEKYDCDELICNSRKFIHENFASVGEKDEFFSLEAKEVTRWISSDEISVETEVDVFKIIVQWVEHNKSERKAVFEELFGHVRLDFLTRDCLQDLVTHELVRDNNVCLRLTVDAIVKMATFATEDDLPQSPRKGLETRVILASGGNYTFCYLPEKNQWKRLPDGSAGRNQKTQMLTFRDQLYTFEQFSKAEMYDPVFNSWSKSNRKDVSADGAIVIVVKGDMYAIKVNKPVGKSTIKRYNVELCTWQTVVESPQGCRNSSCFVAGGSYLYLLGGSAPGSFDYVAKAERFNIAENQWEEIADMQQGRGGAFGVATKEKIFVAGGLNEKRKVSRRCEVYNVSTNEWHIIGRLNTCRVYGSMVCLNGTCYVLGGTKNNRDRLLSVECYDSTEDKWIEKTSIPVERYASANKSTFTGCVMKLSKGVLKMSDFFMEELIEPPTGKPAFGSLSGNNVSSVSSGSSGTSILGSAVTSGGPSGVLGSRAQVTSGGPSGPFSFGAKVTSGGLFGSGAKATSGGPSGFSFVAPASPPVLVFELSGPSSVFTSGAQVTSGGRGGFSLSGSTAPPPVPVFELSEDDELCEDDE